MFGDRDAQLKQRLRAGWGRPRQDEIRIDRVAHYHERVDKGAALQVLSEQTRRDIDLGELFAFVDRTTSAMGRQVLFSRLLTVPRAPDFSRQEQLIERFSGQEQARLNAQLSLSKLSGDEAYDVARLFQEPFVKPPSTLPVMMALSAVSALALVACVLAPRLALFVLALFATNLYFHYQNKKFIVLYSRSIPQLSRLCGCAEALSGLGLPPWFAEAVGPPLKAIGRLRTRMSLFTLEANQDADMLTSIGHLALEYLKIQLLLEPLIVFNVLAALREKQGDIRALFELVAEVDCALSVASLRAGQGQVCLPTLDAGAGLAFTDLYHPLVPDGVANSLSVRGRSVLLTGSNMSGKTTFIRAVAISTLFAQTLNTCFASRFELAPMTLRSVIRISDDVSSGRSYYFEEVLAIKEVIAQSEAEGRSLFLLDEIFKGTNTIERIAAGAAVLAHICKHDNLVFVSTHDIELTELLREAYALYHFTETVQDGNVRFDYRLKPGPLPTRNAIRILEINGYPDTVIEAARAIERDLET